MIEFLICAVIIFILGVFGFLFADLLGKTMIVLLPLAFIVFLFIYELIQDNRVTKMRFEKIEKELAELRKMKQ